MNNRLLSLLLFLTAFILPQARAQQGEVPYVPMDLLDTAIRVQGDSVTVCVFRDVASTEFDIAVTRLIADSLLLDHRTLQVPADFSLFDEGDFYYAVYLHLVNDCDLVAGISLTGGLLPEWLATTAAYAAPPFVVVADAAKEAGRLGDIPAGEAVGVQIGSYADLSLVSWNTSQQQSRRWRRIPYGDDALLLERVADGSISAGLLWYPNFVQAEANAAGDFRLLDLNPLPDLKAEIGFAVFANQSWLISQFDAAISSLLESGELTELAQEHGIMPEDD